VRTCQPLWNPVALLSFDSYKFDYTENAPTIFQFVFGLVLARGVTCPYPADAVGGVLFGMLAQSRIRASTDGSNS
jgi:hypothetical protein